MTSPVPDDEILAAELARLDRKLEATDGERRRLADLYQAGLLDLHDVQRRVRDVDARRRELGGRREELTSHRRQLVADNELGRRVRDFASRAAAGIDKLDFKKRQQLVRLVVDEVRVDGWQVEIHLRIALEPEALSTERTDGHRRGARAREVRSRSRHARVSSEDGLRSLRGARRRVLPQAPEARPRRRLHDTTSPPAPAAHAMTTIFRTVVLDIPATPLGLLAREWKVEHRCTICGSHVGTADLIRHAQAHSAETIEAPDADIP